MDTVLLARLQFALTISFHYLFPPLTIGLGVLLAAMEGLHLKTGDALYRRMSEFWARVLGLTFAMGVATGIVMEFEFGTNWAAYSRFVGDVFGSPLAAEAVLAFFLESVFLAVVLFGRDKVGPVLYFLSTVLVAFGAHLSAFWIIVANSWQQTPAGFRIVGEGAAARAEIVDFWAMVFNPSTVDRFTHTIVGAWQSGAFLVVSVSAFYLLMRRHEAFAKASLKFGLALALLASLSQLETGHMSTLGVAKNQPAKFAAIEAHYEKSAPAPLHLIGWVDAKNERVRGLAVPGLASFLLSGDPHRPVTGLRAFPPQDRPPVAAVFLTHHMMVSIGMALIGLSLLGVFFWRRGTLYEQTWLLLLYLPSFLLPQAANQLGWQAAEVGRQPWLVYNLLRTSEGVSKVVPAGHILFSLLLFTLVYAGLFLVYAYLLAAKVLHGPEEARS
ncbi:MAG TPA: cytochrome ubiquinol oxidase subunit I [Elusimicrobia bacterium]|nr:cytochrome ubiquinol oxidase subunit I [Elusimicrobiota bacterium]